MKTPLEGELNLVSFQNSQNNEVEVEPFQNLNMANMQ